MYGNLSSGPLGKNPRCKECERARGREQYYRNHEETKKKYRDRWKHNKSYRKNQLKTMAVWSKTDSGVYKNYKYSKNGRKFGFEIDKEFFIKLINSDCYYCGKENCRGVDRVNSNEGYTPENVTPCCGICNRMKLNLTEHNFFAMIKRIYEKHSIDALALAYLDNEKYQ